MYSQISSILISGFFSILLKFIFKLGGPSVPILENEGLSVPYEQVQEYRDKVPEDLVKKGSKNKK